MPAPISLTPCTRTASACIWGGLELVLTSMASSVCDCCLAFCKRREDSSVSPLPLGHCPQANTQHCPSIQALVLSAPLSSPPPAWGAPACWGTAASPFPCPGSLAHPQCAAVGCTCCLSSWKWCSHSSPCSRYPGVPCRLSWTCTHSGDVSVGNKRERGVLMGLKGKSGYFSYFLPGCSSQLWQEWGQISPRFFLLCWRTDPSQAFVPPSQRGQGQSRTPPALALHQGSPSPLLTDGEAARSWMGSAAVWGSHTPNPTLLPRGWVTPGWDCHFSPTLPRCRAGVGTGWAQAAQPAGEGATASWGWRRP